MSIKRPDLVARNRENATHRMTHTSTYHIWVGILARCNNENCKDYIRYGARGIRVCAEWSKFENFLRDMGERPEGMQIDRLDNNGDYCRENCRWTTPSMNSRNRRSSKMITFNGETKCLAQWAEDLGIERKTLQMRIKSWSIERALTTPYIARKES